MILSSKDALCNCADLSTGRGGSELTLEEKRQLQRRAARFAELSRRAAVLEAEEGKPEEAVLRPVPLWATNVA